MANDPVGSGAKRLKPWRIALWGAAAFLLLLPLVTNAPWTLSDYVVMGVLLGSVALGVDLVVRRSPSLAYGSGAVLAIIAAFLTIWVNLAVGMIGPDDNPYNLLFGGVLFVALIGAILAWFGAAGMAVAMAVAAIAQAAIGAFGLATDMRGGVVSMAFAGLWLLAAVLFWAAARNGPAAGSAA